MVQCVTVYGVCILSSVGSKGLGRDWAEQWFKCLINTMTVVTKITSPLVLTIMYVPLAIRQNSSKLAWFVFVLTFEETAVCFFSSLYIHPLVCGTHFHLYYELTSTTTEIQIPSNRSNTIWSVSHGIKHAPLFSCPTETRDLISNSIQQALPLPLKYI